MTEYWEALTLGNAAILTNVCLLPLYPGLVVMMAGRAGDRRERSVRPLIGLFVLAGVVTFMVAIGFVLHQVSRSVADIMAWVLPLMYALVAVLGVSMLAGFNPFARLATAHAPIVRSPTASAYLYGMFLAPMSLPCAGPFITAAFTLGTVRGSGALADSLVYFAFFALGFGWPLVLLPLLAAPVQQRVMRFLTRHHRAVAVVSGVLMIAVAVIGFAVEVRREVR